LSFSTSDFRNPCGTELVLDALQLWKKVREDTTAANAEQVIKATADQK